MKKLLSSDLIRYNANTRGTSTGDCSARAISLAFGIDYQKARKALNDSAKAHNLAKKRPIWDYNSHSNCVEVIQNLGGGNMDENDERVSVDSFADNHPSGTYIIWCSKDGISSAGNHLVTIIDGKIYDSWDSRNYKVKGYWTIKAGISSKDISTNLPKAIRTFFDNKDANAWNLYIVGVFDSIVQKNRRLKKLSEKYNTDIKLSIEWRRVNYSSYNFDMDYKVILSIPKYGISENYSSKIAITFKPTLPIDEVENYFNSSFAGKMHPFINNVSIKAEDILEGENLTSGTSPTSAYEAYKKSWDGIVRRSFNNLPYWVRKLVTYFKVDPPSRYDDYYGYDDKVELRMKKPPFDTTYADNQNEEVGFETESMRLLKKALEHYKQTGNYEDSYDIARDF